VHEVLLVLTDALNMRSDLFNISSLHPIELRVEVDDFLKERFFHVTARVGISSPAAQSLLEGG
jgi:hypothetical protein